MGWTAGPAGSVRRPSPSSPMLNVYCIRRIRVALYLCDGACGHYEDNVLLGERSWIDGADKLKWEQTGHSDASVRWLRGCVAFLGVGGDQRGSLFNAYTNWVGIFTCDMVFLPIYYARFS
jgi:hypothetical protein